MLFDIVETADELRVGALQGVVGVELVEPGGIDYREEEVAQLVGAFLLVLALQLSLQLGQLLMHLVPHIFFLLPVEAHVAGLVLYAVGLDERGQ